MWNINLQEVVVSATSLNDYKAKLDNHWNLNNEELYLFCELLYLFCAAVRSA